MSSLASINRASSSARLTVSTFSFARIQERKRAAYVVPNHMLEQFSREFIEAYPNAKILVFAGFVLPRITDPGCIS